MSIHTTDLAVEGRTPCATARDLINQGHDPCDTLEVKRGKVTIFKDAATLEWWAEREMDQTGRVVSCAKSSDPLTRAEEDYAQRTQAPIKPTNWTVIHPNEMCELVDELWSELEDHYDTSRLDLSLLRKLDAAALDGTLTNARIERVKNQVLGRPHNGLPASYKYDDPLIGEARRCEINHATGTVPEAYWSAKDDKGIPNRSHRKTTIKGERHFKKVRKGYEVTLGTGEDRTTVKFTTAGDARRYRDIMVESRKADAYSRKMANGDGDHDAREARILSDASDTAEARKEAIRRVQRQNPDAPLEMTISAILRLPEFDRSGEPKVIPEKAAK